MVPLILGTGIIIIRWACLQRPVTTDSQIQSFVRRTPHRHDVDTITVLCIELNVPDKIFWKSMFATFIDVSCNVIYHINDHVF